MYSDPANHTAVIQAARAGADHFQGGLPMSARLLRFDATRLDTVRLEAMVFRADSVRFEACATFRGTDGELCECGWLEADHVAASGRRHFAGLRPRRRQASTAAPRTA